MMHSRKMIRLLLLAFIGALAGVALAAGAGAATADPATDPGWMPTPPSVPLTPDQMKMLEPASIWSGTQGYSMIDCKKHQDFPTCADAEPSGQSSKAFQYVIFSSDGKRYYGVTSTIYTPQYLDPVHKGLMNANHEIRCDQSLATKIPMCSTPWRTNGAGALFDADGKFVKLLDGGGEAHAGVQTTVDWNKVNPLKVLNPKNLLKSWFAQACESFGKFSGDLIKDSMTWWLNTKSVDLSYGAALTGQKPVQLLVMTIMMLGILFSAGLMMVTRRAQPAADLLMGAFKYMLIASLSLVILQGALAAGDDYAHQMVTNGSGGLGDKLAGMLGIATLQNPAGVFLLGLVAFVLGFIQWVFAFARQAGIVVLYSLIVIAAAGQLTPWGRQWFPRIASLCIALVLYKPAAAMLYSLGWNLIGNEQTLSNLMVGLAIIGLCVLSLPTMLMFFSFITPNISGGGSAGAALALGAGGGALLGSKLGDAFGSAGDSQGNAIEHNGPGTGRAEADPSPGNSPTGPLVGPGGGDDSASGNAEADMSAGADLGGPGPESPDATGGVPVSGGGEGMDGAESAESAGGGAAAAGGGAGLLVGAASQIPGQIQGASDSLASNMTATDDGTGPGMGQE